MRNSTNLQTAVAVAMRNIGKQAGTSYSTTVQITGAVNAKSRLDMSWIDNKNGRRSVCLSSDNTVLYYDLEKPIAQDAADLVPKVAKEIEECTAFFGRRITTELLAYSMTGADNNLIHFTTATTLKKLSQGLLNAAFRPTILEGLNNPDTKVKVEISRHQSDNMVPATLLVLEILYGKSAINDEVARMLAETKTQEISLFEQRLTHATACVVNGPMLTPVERRETLFAKDVLPALAMAGLEKDSMRMLQ